MGIVFYSKNKIIDGFTLIELSIALVIIGLIVGGVLTGQDLINAAAQRAQISQIEKYNTAVHTFQYKYGGLPGDLALNLATQFGFSTSGCVYNYGNRDGNGYLDGQGNGGSGTGIMQDSENLLVWEDLSQTGLIDGAFPGGGVAATGCNYPLAADATTPATIRNYLPQAKIGGGNFLYTYDGSSSAVSCCGGGNWFGLSVVTSLMVESNYGQLLSNPGLTVLQAYNIDKKIDDGMPTTGSVLANELNDWYVWWTNGNDATPCYTGNSYSVGSNANNINCGLSFAFQ